MKIKLLKEIVSSIAGSGAVGIVDLLNDKKNVNEFLIAKKLKLTINQTRNILYKLADEGLVSFIRKKDSKKGGWYTYFWTLNAGKSLTKFKEILSNEIENLRVQKENLKKTRFFNCPNCEIELTEENALLNEYNCPECGELLQLKDNAPVIAAIEKEISRREDILKEINEELDTISKIEEKVRGRRAKADVKKKVKERLERKKEREKLAKKLGKKKPKPSKKKGNPKKRKR